MTEKVIKVPIESKVCIVTLSISASIALSRLSLTESFGLGMIVSFFVQ